MQIADFKAKVAAAVHNNQAKGGSIVKKLEAISANLKSTPTILAHDLKINGEISGSGLIEIEGAVKGTINGNSVIVREGGIVEGTIIAESLNIKGKFEGNIKAKNISIEGKATVMGEIEYSSLSVEDGACVDGQFKKL